MKKLFTWSAFLIVLLVTGGSFASGLWQSVPLTSAPSTKVQVFHPEHYLVYTFNEEWLKIQMFSLSTDAADGMVIELPMPDGSMKSFKVWQDPMMHAEMAAKYPEIKTFTAYQIGNQHVTAKLDFTVYGFHAMIFDGENTSFIDPYDNYHDGYYMVHYKRDEVRTAENKMKCEVKNGDENGPAGESMKTQYTDLPKLSARTGNGWTRKNYDLALCADHFYCQAATALTSPTIAQCLSKMTTSMNRINGVYEREFSVHMNFVTKEDTLIWPTNTGSVNGNDPFNTIDANPNACLTQCQTSCDGRIGSANYDLGHVFTTGGGGLSALGVVCSNGSKANSVTGSPTPVGDGYDIDYVAHEMGHEFGANHTFANGNDGSCGGGNVSNTHSYEPGSGTTIMAYAGICSPDDLAMHSEAYFHASSLLEIQAKLVGSENACATAVATGNKLVSLATFSNTYSIPYKTPFELIAPTAVDSVADTSTMYCWEQWNLGAGSASTSSRFVNTFVKGPIFRSWFPVTTETRVFPKMSKVLLGTLSDAGTEGAQGEKAPDTARFLTFKLTVRDILLGNGCFLFPDDTIHLNAVQTTTKAGFKVTSQGTTGISYNGATAQTITWDVVGTNAAPVSATNVVIYMSTDGGTTWAYNLGTFPNSGTASVTLPNPGTTSSTCRFKVKGSGNVFFNVNLKNFTVTHNTTAPSAVANVTTLADETKVYPVPASDVLHISTGNFQALAVIYNTVGQAVWQGTINGQSEVSVATWAKGVYHIQLMNRENGERTVKSFVVE